MTLFMVPLVVAIMLSWLTLVANVFRFLDQVNVEACKALHIGDDKKADKMGANNVGIDCW